MKRLLPALLCLGLIGCATTTNKYASTYNEAVTTGHSIVINKEGDFETIQSGINQELSSIGYNTVSYSSFNEGFMVFIKDKGFGSPLLNSDAHPTDARLIDAHLCKIILKYTNIDEGKTRIDLVNGGAGAFTKDEIDRDIQRLAKLIRSM